MSAMGMNDTDIILPIAVRRKRRIFSIPKRSDHKWRPDISMFECHQHLILNLRQEICSPALSSHGHRDPHPPTLIVIGEPGKLDAHSRHVVWVLIIGDNPDHHAKETARFVYHALRRQ